MATPQAERHYHTRNRDEIASLLQHERRYLTAAAVARLLRTAGSKVALSTIYRTLDLLVSAGLASRRTDAGGEAAYIACSEDHHHHAICRSCGHVDEVDCAAMERFAGLLMEHHAFTLDAHAIEFYGRCARCV
ncbi:MAG: Fur family transcriptional regulator [Vulcanimicrobiaceae bacterium]